MGGHLFSGQIKLQPWLCLFWRPVQWKVSSFYIVFFKGRLYSIGNVDKNPSVSPPPHLFSTSPGAYILMWKWNKISDPHHFINSFQRMTQELDEITSHDVSYHYHLTTE